MDFDKYKNILEYPECPRKPKLDGVTPGKEEIEKYLIEKQAYDLAKQEYEIKRKAYYEETGRLENEFRTDALKAVGLEKELYPEDMISRAYSYAWEQGHSCGYSEIYSCLCGIAYVITGDK